MYLDTQMYLQVFFGETSLVGQEYIFTYGCKACFSSNFETSQAEYIKPDEIISTGYTKG